MIDRNQLKHTAYHEVGHATAALLLKGTVRELHIEAGNGHLGETDADLEGVRNNAVMILASFVAQQFYDPDYYFDLPEAIRDMPFDSWVRHGRLKPDDPTSDYGRLKNCLIQIVEEQYGSKAATWSQAEVDARVNTIFQLVLEEATQLLEPYKDAVHNAAALLLDKKRLTGAELYQALGLS